MHNIRSLLTHFWRHFMHDSLYRNSVFLLLNMGITSVSGFAFWTICTRLYPQTEVGYATALIAALALAVSLSNLGLNRTTIRFFHNHPSRQQYLSTSITIMLLSATVFGIVMSVFLKKFGLPHTTIFTAIVFILAAIVSSVKNIFDNVFIALKSASANFIENLTFNITKVALPFIFVGFGFLGIFSAQVVGVALAVVVSIYILARHHNLKSVISLSIKPMQGKWQFAFGNYVSDLVGSLPNNMLPLIIVAKIGPAAGALWYVAMQIANVLFLICSSINQSLFAEAAADEHRLYAYVKQTSRLMAFIVIPLVIGFSVFARPILSIFGPEYTNAATIMRILVWSSLLVMMSYISGSILVIMKKIRYLLIVNLVNAVVVVGLSLIFGHSLVQIGVFWVVGEIVNDAFFIFGAIWFSKRRQGSAYAQA